jgi:hypothetical protein
MGLVCCVGKVVGEAGVLGAVVEKARICRVAARRVRGDMVVMFGVFGIFGVWVVKVNARS